MANVPAKTLTGYQLQALQIVLEELDQYLKNTTAYAAYEELMNETGPIVFLQSGRGDDSRESSLSYSSSSIDASNSVLEDAQMKAAYTSGSDPHGQQSADVNIDHLRTEHDVEKVKQSIAGPLKFFNDYNYYSEMTKRTFRQWVGDLFKAIANLFIRCVAKKHKYSDPGQCRKHFATLTECSLFTPPARPRRRAAESTQVDVVGASDDNRANIWDVETTRIEDIVRTTLDKSIKLNAGCVENRDRSDSEDSEYSDNGDRYPYVSCY